MNRRLQCHGGTIAECPSWLNQCLCKTILVSTDAVSNRYSIGPTVSNLNWPTNQLALYSIHSLSWYSEQLLCLNVHTRLKVWSRMDFSGRDRAAAKAQSSAYRVHWTTVHFWWTPAVQAYHSCLWGQLHWNRWSRSTSLFTGKHSDMQLHPKWHSIPYIIVYYFWPEPKSSALYSIVNRVPFVTHTHTQRTTEWKWGKAASRAWDS